MKKVFSLILAVAMVLSLASVAFAAVTPWTVKTSSSTTDAKAVYGYNNEEFYTYKDHVFTKNTTGVTTFGKVVYYPLYVDNAFEVVATEDKSVASLKLTVNFESGEEYVDSYAIVKKYGYCTGTDAFVGYVDASNVTGTGESFNGYYIAVTTKGTATGTKDVSGVMTLTGKSGAGATVTKLKDESVHFAFQLAWAKVDTDTNYVIGTNATLDTNEVYVGFGKEVKYTFAAGVTYTVTMVDGEKTVVKYNEDVNKAIEDANELAGISFYNFNDASFKRAGTLSIAADEDEPGYCYEILADGSLKDITSCYDEEEAAFTLKIKKLGNYCTSDLKLVDAEGTVAAVAGEVNPVTGAIA